MARIGSIELPKEKRIDIGLTAIYGIGRVTAAKICAALNLDPSIRCKDLSDSVLAQLREYIEKNHVTEGDLRKDIRLNIKAKVDKASYVGIRHRGGYTVRGQRTQGKKRKKNRGTN